MLGYMVGTVLASAKGEPAMFAPKTASNNPALAGAPASRKVLFGGNSRFAIFAIHTRFDAVSWFVADAELADEITGHPAIIVQSATFEDAISRVAH